MIRHELCLAELRLHPNMSVFTGYPTVFSSSPLIVDEAAPSHELGELMVTPDGRRFRYVKVGSAAALVLGDLLQGPAEATGNQSRIVAAAAVGDLTITTTDTVTVTANEYAGGYVVVTGEASTGRGQILRIKSHPAATAAVVTLTLEDPVTVALTATSQVDLVKNPFNGVIQMPGTRSGTPVGVAINEITASQYGWIQVGGPACVLVNGGVTVGSAVVAADNAGAVEVGANGTTEAFSPVGYAMTGIATTENGAVFLNIS